MEKYGMVFSGSGGQGVITAAIIMAESVVLHEGLIAVQTQVYGAEARGSAVRADVIVSKSEIRYPKVRRPNLLVCLTQEAYNKFNPIIYPGGIIITDSHYVKLGRKVDARQHELPLFDSVMEKIGDRVALNICVLGAVVSLTKLVREESVMKTLETRVPEKYLKINQDALKLGIELGSTISD